VRWNCEEPLGAGVGVSYGGRDGDEEGGRGKGTEFDDGEVRTQRGHDVRGCVGCWALLGHVRVDVCVAGELRGEAGRGVCEVEVGVSLRITVYRNMPCRVMSNEY
jgi:hypothetical protein